MYVKYFKFNGKPFGINPDPRFFFNSNTHKKALLSLGEGLSQGQGFVVVTGDPGMGKTTLMTALQYMLAKTNITIARIVNTQLDSGELLRYVAAELDLPYEDQTKVSLLKSIEHYLLECQAQNKRILVIVDESQNLSDSAIDELRMLMNIVSDNNSLIQIILFGQTRLQEQLYSDIFEPLRQRIVAKYHLEYFDQQQTKAYIFHRLRTVSWIGNPAITPEAFEAVHLHSRGIPAKINMICERMLLAACLNGSDMIRDVDVSNIVREMHEDFSDATFENSLVEGMIDVLVSNRLDTMVTESEAVPAQQIYAPKTAEAVLPGLNEGLGVKTTESKAKQVDLKKKDIQSETSENISAVDISLENGVSQDFLKSDQKEIETSDVVEPEMFESSQEVLSLPNEDLIIDFNEEDVNPIESEKESHTQQESIEDPTEEPVEVIPIDHEIEIIEVKVIDPVEPEVLQENRDDIDEDVFSITEEDLVLEVIEPEVDENEFLNTEEEIVLEEFKSLTEEDLLLITPDDTSIDAEEEHFVRTNELDKNVQDWLNRQQKEHMGQNKAKDEFDFHSDRDDAGHLNPFSKSSSVNFDDTLEEPF